MIRNLIGSIALAMIAIGIGVLIYSNVKLSGRANEADKVLAECKEQREDAAKGFLYMQTDYYGKLRDCLIAKDKSGDEIERLRENWTSCQEGMIHFTCDSCKKEKP
jgi:hypothetical protein